MYYGHLGSWYNKSAIYKEVLRLKLNFQKSNGVSGKTILLSILLALTLVFEKAVLYGNVVMEFSFSENLFQI